MGGGGDPEERIALLENYMEGNVILGDFDTDIISERVSKLKGGLLVIQPGGRSKVETDECRDRIEDSVSAVRAALEEGFVPGGGAALLHASRSLTKLADECDD